VDATNAAAERFRVALELFETGVELKRAALHRAHPGITPSRLEELLGDWLRDRPGAREGDGPPRSS
jgi:hypothetical protein